MFECKNRLLFVPTFETARLKFRSHGLDDLSNCTALWSDPIVTRFIGGKPLTEEEAWVRLLRYVGHWSLLGFGYWAVEEKSTGKFIGEVGFQENQRDLNPSLKGLLETGWVFASHAHGKGYANEAVRAALAWSDLHFPTTKTACIIDTPNLASIRVAEKCGYREIARADYQGTVVMVFHRDPAT
jgi:RimJ/RimL family protein N-acetyltransferase